MKLTIYSMNINDGLFRNFSNLLILQTLNLLIPIVLYPLLLNRIGTFYFGQIIYCQSIVGFLLMVVNFGFDLTGSKEISINRNNLNKRSEVFSGIIILKTIFLFFSFFVLYLFCKLNLYGSNHSFLLFLSMWICISDWLFPIWFFQGLEKTSYITITSLISKLIFTFLTIIFITEKDDYILVPAFWGIGSIISGLISLFIIFIKYEVKLSVPKFKYLRNLFISSFQIFISNLVIKSFTNINKLFIGSSLGMDSVAYYDIADKVVSVFKMPQNVLSQVLFPRLVSEGTGKFRFYFNVSLFFSLALLLLLNIFATQVVETLLLEKINVVINLIRILSLVIPFFTITSLIGVNKILVDGRNNLYVNVYLGSFVFYLILSYLNILFFHYNIYGFAAVTVIVEFITCVLFYSVGKKKIIVVTHLE